ncbi:hypothetical protein GW17_00024319, partial [Ensete ventricosum]
IIFFAKGCPNPSFPFCAVATDTVVVPVQAATALACWQPPCQGSATPAAGGKIGRGWQPLAAARQPAPFSGAALQAAVPAGGYRPCGLVTIGLAIKDSAVGDLYVELVATFDLKCQTCNNLTVEEVICAAHVDENGDGLLFQKSSKFHRLRVGVAGQCVHYVVDRLGLFLQGFFFRFKGFFRWLEGWLRIAFGKVRVLVQQDMPKGNAVGFFVKE